MRLLIWIFSLAALAGCGTKTALVLPHYPVPATAPQAPPPMPSSNAPGAAQ